MWCCQDVYCCSFLFLSSLNERRQNICCFSFLFLSFLNERCQDVRCCSFLFLTFLNECCQDVHCCFYFFFFFSSERSPLNCLFIISWYSFVLFFLLLQTIVVESFNYSFLIFFCRLLLLLLIANDCSRINCLIFLDILLSSSSYWEWL